MGSIIVAGSWEAKEKGRGTAVEGRQDIGGQGGGERCSICISAPTTLLYACLIKEMGFGGFGGGGAEEPDNCQPSDMLVLLVI